MRVAGYGRGCSPLAERLVSRVPTFSFNSEPEVLLESRTVDYQLD